MEWNQPEPCGCSLENGRCEQHTNMMRAIHAAWQTWPNDGLLKIWAESDGYGEPGYIPAQGYDWSGIRDSSIGAIERMYDTVMRASESHTQR